MYTAIGLHQALTVMSSANCEKQIITPDVRILFCSKECHRQDRLAKASSTLSDVTPPRTPLPESVSFENLHRHPQALHRSPTSPYDPTNRYSISSISSTEDTRPRVHREPSDASRWLGSFQSSSNLQDTAEHAEQSTPRRPRLGRGNSGAPSLSYTSSSYSAAGMSLPRTPYSTHSLSYGPSTGPLPSRNNPYSPSSYAPKSIDLVQPMSMLSMTAPDLPSVDGSPRRRKASVAMGSSQDTIVQGEILGYEKKSIDTLRGTRDTAAASPSHGSLKQMFAFAAMQSAPSSPVLSATHTSRRASRTFVLTHHD